MNLESPAFKNNGRIPSKFSCDGEDVSPELGWKFPPKGTKSFALICDDPDAPMGTFVHWIVFNIPASENGMKENSPPEGMLPNDTIQGRNDFGRNGYGGPCPPSGTHRYFFHLYALDTLLNLSQYATKQDLLKVIQGHVIGEAELVGLYGRR